MKKLFHIARRQSTSLEHNISINRDITNNDFDEIDGRSVRRRISVSGSSIQIVRGAYNIDLNKVDSSFSKLHRACLRNDHPGVLRYVNKIDCNTMDNCQRSPIHLATVNGNVDIVRLLIQHGACVDVRDGDGKTPLVKSIECGHENLINYLLEVAHANPNIADAKYGNTALQWAISSESIFALNRLLDTRKCNLNAVNNENETCLHMACRWSSLGTKVFEKFLSSGIEINVKNTVGHTALDIAHSLNNLTAISAIVNHQKFHDDKDDNQSLSHNFQSESDFESKFKSYNSDLDLNDDNTNYGVAARKEADCHNEKILDGCSETFQRFISVTSNTDESSGRFAVHNTGPKDDVLKTENFQLPSKNKINNHDDNVTSRNAFQFTEEKNGEVSDKIKIFEKYNVNSDQKNIFNNEKSQTELEDDKEKTEVLSTTSQIKLIGSTTTKTIRTVKASNLAEDASQIHRNGNTNEQTYFETKKMCEEFRRKFDQKNRENCELEKKIIHLESLSKHLSLDIGAVEEHNHDLERKLSTLQQQQQNDRNQLNQLLAQVNQLSDENVALRYERQQLANNLAKLKLSIDKTRNSHSIQVSKPRQVSSTNINKKIGDENDQNTNQNNLCENSNDHELDFVERKEFQVARDKLKNTIDRLRIQLIE